MKKTIILGIMLLLALSFTVKADDSVIVSISLQRYEPIPASPGEYIDVWISMENQGSNDAPNAAIEFIDNYPFSMEREEDKIIDIGRLLKYNAKVEKFKVRIDQNAIEGTNTLKIRYTDDANSDTWVEKEFNIDVRTQDATIAINAVEVTPSPLLPGNTANINIRVKNLADSLLKDISVKLDFSTVYSGASVVNDLPFVPLGSTSEKKIKQLRGGETSLFSFDVVVYPDAETKIYKVPATITFYDEIGTEYAVEDIIGIVVEDEPDMIIKVASTELQSSQATGEITFEFINKGFGDIKFMTVTLEETDYLEVLSTSNTEYVGTVDSDDYETVDFKVKLTAESDIVEFPLKLEYKDALNNKYEVTELVTLNVASQKTNGKSNSIVGIVVAIIIVIAVVIFFVIRKRRKRK